MRTCDPLNVIGSVNQGIVGRVAQRVPLGGPRAGGLRKLQQSELLFHRIKMCVAVTNNGPRVEYASRPAHRHGWRMVGLGQPRSRTIQNEQGGLDCSMTRGKQWPDHHGNDCGVGRPTQYTTWR